MVIMQQMFILMIIMMVGLVAQKRNIITDEAGKKLSSLVVNISNPCLIITSVLDGSDMIKRKELLEILMIAIVVYIVLMVIAAFIPVLLRVPESEYGVYRAMTVFSNIGFMGLPLVSAVYGKEALLYAAVFSFPFNFLVYTYGVYVLQGKEGKIQKIQWKMLLNPGIIATVIAILIYLTDFSLPYIVGSSIDMIGNTTSPLSMMIIGASFANIDFKTVFTNKKLLLFSLIKLVIIPVAGLFVIHYFIDNTVIQGVCLIMLATPVASMVVMLANEYGGDTKLGSAGIAVTSVLSVFTLSALAYLGFGS